MINRRTLIGAAVASPLLANAQGAFPNKTITIVVPFPAGGTTDVTARILALEMQKSLGQTVIVENKPGANGTLGSAGVQKALPDGYTLLMSGVGSQAVNHVLQANMPYDSAKDFTHISLATTGPNILVVHPSFPANNLKEFVAHVKANPGKFNFASAGVGASGHMAMELLKVQAGLDLIHIPYRGGGPAFQDLVGGQIPMMFTNQDGPAGFVAEGKLKVIGVADLERNSLYPTIPTIAEQGFPNFAAVSWNGVSAPPNLPADILKVLNEHVNKALKSEQITEKLVKNGFKVGASTPEAYTKFVGDEMKKWADVAKSAGIKAQ